MEAGQGRNDVAASEVRTCQPVRPQSVAALMIAWQETGSHEALESLVAAVLPQVRRTIATTLQSRGIRDPAAVDEAWSLVLDHLRRLAGGEGGDRQVTKFNPTRRSEAADGPGWGYLRHLARSRARDVARRRRRRKSVPFSQLTPAAERRFEETLVAADGGGESEPPLADRLLAAARSLPPRQRLLVELLLDGKSQAVIAHVLGLNQGTVSRLRTRAITSLRRLLDD